MAHEINNPLEGMSNYLRLLEEDLAAGDTRDAPQLVRRVREGLDRAAGTVRQVLAFADPGRRPKRPLDLAAVVDDTVGFVAANPAFRRVAVRRSGESVPVTVVGDPTTLGQLFLNLLLNACQAQPDGGEVEVRVTRDEDDALVSVADRGPGLDPEVAARLFEPFISTRGSSGLGLAVCHGIVSAHAGTLRGGNRPAGGAEFEVRLPLAAAASGEGRAEDGKEG
jgi:signal transduction histidine kinase